MLAVVMIAEPSNWSRYYMERNEGRKIEHNWRHICAFIYYATA